MAARHKNVVWDINELPGLPIRVSILDAQLAVLMDIRDELMTLNNFLRCTNLGHTLTQLVINTKRKKPKKERKNGNS
jgi:hypothetical protein